MKQKINNYIKSSKVRFGKWFNSSRLVLAVIMLVIGSTYTFNYIEGVKFYEVVIPQANQTIENFDSYIETKGAKAKEIEEVAEVSSVEIMIDKIGKLESNNGKNETVGALHNYCKDLGKSNEYGYGGMAKKWCYSNDETARGVVQNWIERNSSLSEGQMLCKYNTGKTSDTCEYYVKYLSL